jgi:hypothetical protein
MPTEKISETYRGYVGSTRDALLVTQAVLNRQLSLIPRRPLEKERPEFIKSGNVFVFIEEYSGIKRWTDGIAWSPLRILGRFLVYRELDKHSLNEKDDKKKKKRKVSIDVSDRKINSPYHISGTWNSDATEPRPFVSRDLGLIKKTMSIATNSNDLNLENKNQKLTIHLICYYNVDDVLNGFLTRPSEDDLKDLTISEGLWNAVKDTQLVGKIPIEDEAYYFLDANYQLQNMSTLEDIDHAKSIHSERHDQSPLLHYGVPQQQKFIPQGSVGPQGMGGPQGLHMLPIPIQSPSFMYNTHKDENIPYQPYRVQRKESSEGSHGSGPPIVGSSTSDINFGGPYGAIHGGSGTNNVAQPGPYYNSYMIPPQVKSYLYESGSSLQGTNHPMFLYPQPLENYYQGPPQQQFLAPQTLLLHSAYNYVIPSTESASLPTMNSISSNNNHLKNNLTNRSRTQSSGNGHLLATYPAFPVHGHVIHGGGQLHNSPQTAQPSIGSQTLPTLPGEEQITSTFSSSNYASSN